MDSSPDSTAALTDNTKDQSILQRVKSWYRGLPDKKRYLEFITALLTIPVLLTVLLSNVTNLQNQKSKDEPSTTPTTAAATVPTTAPVVYITPSGKPDPTVTPVPQCTPGVGQITIIYPEEKDTVSGDPICLDISRKSGNYCSVAYSYRINSSAWSSFTGNSVCMYGLTPGEKKLDLRIRSIVSDDEEIITRLFTVAGPTPTPATQSGTVTAK